MGFLRIIFVGSFLSSVLSFSYVGAESLGCKGDEKNNKPFDPKCMNDSIKYLRAIERVNPKFILKNEDIALIQSWRTPADLVTKESQKLIDSIKKQGDGAAEKYKADLKYYVGKKETANKRLNSNSLIGPNRWVSPIYNKEIKATCGKLRDLGEELPPGCVVMLNRRDIR